VDNSRTVVVLGSTDPEMVQIAALAREAGAVVVQAQCEGRPVRPGQPADREGIDAIYQSMLSVTADRVLFVEQLGRSQDNVANNIGSWCLETYGRSDGWPVQFVEIDHHDPRQTWPTEMPLWERSSIGQIAAALGVQLTDQQRWVGALDHDLPGALALAREQGALDEVLMVYAQGAAHLFGGVDPATYVAQARATEVHLAGLTPWARGILPIFQRFAPDSTTKGATGESYPLPALPLALSLRRVGGLSIIQRADGVYAWRLQAATPEQVRWFLGPEMEGLVQGMAQPNAPYGQPERGFAGGVVHPAYLQTLPWATRDQVVHQVAILSHLGTDLSEDLSASSRS
jgi:hypothetical protein